jgi:hypothetical protein
MYPNHPILALEMPQPHPAEAYRTFRIALSLKKKIKIYHSEEEVWKLF